MSEKEPKPTLETTEDIYNYLKDGKMLRTGPELREVIMDFLLELSKNFKPNNLAMAFKIDRYMEKLKLSVEEREKFFEALTGYNLKKLIDEPEKDQENEEQEDKPVPNDKDVKDKINGVIDTKFSNLALNIVRGGIGTYFKLEGDKTFWNISKGALITVGTLGTLAVGTTLLLTAKTLRLVGKGLKALKGTAERALQRNALKNIQKTKSALQQEEKDYKEVLDKQKVELDKVAEENQEKDSNAYKTIQDLRENKIEAKDAEPIIIDAYNKETVDRDANLSRLVNYNVIEQLAKKLDIEPDKMAELMRDITFDKETGEIQYSEGTDIDFAKLNSSDIDKLKAAVNYDIILENMSESEKLQIFDYLEIKNNKMQLREGKNLEDISDTNMKKIVKRLIDQEPKKSNDRSNNSNNSKSITELFSSVNKSNETLEFLIMCEQEVLTHAAIEVNGEMYRSCEKREEKLQEGKQGFFRSSYEALRAKVLHSNARDAVERRIDTYIIDSINRNEGASQRLVKLAREKLLENVQEVRNQNRDRGEDERS